MRLAGPNHNQANLIRSMERVKRTQQEQNVAASAAAMPYRYADAFQRALDKIKS